MHDFFVGIDVAKDTLEVHERPSSDRVTVTNDERGLRELVARFAARAGAHRAGSHRRR